MWAFHREGSAGPALFGQHIEHAGQQLLEAGTRLGAVVHDHNGPGPQGPLGRLLAFHRIATGVEIPGQHRPHDDAASPGDGPRLCRGDAAVWGPEQAGSGQGLALEVGPQVGPVWGGPPRFVAHGVIAPGVTLPTDSVKHVGMALDVFAHTEEGALLSGSGQFVQDEGGPLRMRPVVKGEVHGRSRPLPDKLGKEGGQGLRNARAVHGLKFGTKPRI